MRSLRLLVLVGLFSASVSSAQQAATSSEAAPSVVAHQLADAHLAVNVPAKGKAKAVFKKDAAVYTLPGGQSPAVLLSLPAYQSPYTLTVSSKRHGMGRTTEIFVPSLVFLDDTFAVIESYGVEDAPTVASNRTLNPTESIYKDFTIDDRSRATRFVLVFTRMDSEGDRIKGAAGLAGGLFGAKVERSSDGTVEFITKPVKTKK